MTDEVIKESMQQDNVRKYQRDGQLVAIAVNIRASEARIGSATGKTVSRKVGDLREGVHMRQYSSLYLGSTMCFHPNGRVSGCISPSRIFVFNVIRFRSDKGEPIAIAAYFGGCLQ